MDVLKEVESEYLTLSNGDYGIVIALGDFRYKRWEDFINQDIKFKVEFLIFPSWNKKFKYVKINNELYSHIRIKRKLF